MADNDPAGPASEAITSAITYGVVGSVVGAIIVATGDGAEIVGAIIMTAFSLVLLVGLIGKGVSLGVRSAEEHRSVLTPALRPDPDDA